MLRRIAVVLVVVLVAGCAGSDSQQQPVSTSEGLQATGRFGGAQLSLSDGAPDAVRGDCDPDDGVDADLCVVAASLDGAQVAVVFENPALLAAPGTYPVGDPGCGGCDPIDDVAVVEVRVDGTAMRATGGSVTIANPGPVRLAGEFQLRFVDAGTLTGTFDVGLPVSR